MKEGPMRRYPLNRSRGLLILVLGTSLVLALGTIAFASSTLLRSQQDLTPHDTEIVAYASQLIDEGRQIFRYDTFGSEHFFGDGIKLHEALAGEQLGGVGPGVSLATALAVGVQVD